MDGIADGAIITRDRVVVIKQRHHRS